MKKIFAVTAATLLLGAFSFAEGYINANDLEKGSITEVKQEEDGFILNASVEKNLSIEKCDAKKSGDEIFTQRISTKGSGDKNVRNIEFPAKAGETISIFCLSSNKSSARPIHVITADGAEVAVLSAEPDANGVNGEVSVVSVQAPADGNYKVFSKSGGAYIYQIKVGK